MSNILDQLRSHISMMAPHQRTREAGRLIIEATKEIDRLQAERKADHEHPAEVDLDKVNQPPDLSLQAVNYFVHDRDVSCEEWQCLCIGLATALDKAETDLFPAIDRLQEWLLSGAYIKFTDGRWLINDGQKGQTIVSGETLKKMLVNLALMDHPT